VTRLVLGRPALTRELLTRALAASDPRHGGAVAVLMNPTSDDWAQARELGARVVLMRPGFDDVAVVAEAVLAGVDAVLDPDAGLDEVRSTVAVVESGGTVLDARQARAVADIARALRTGAATPRLTRRERDVLECLDMGRSVKQTARDLGLADKTVENVRSRLFRKLGARNAGHALVSASRFGILS
jgi:DNA-binding NarL/FixJ family response regulator